MRRSRGAQRRALPPAGGAMRRGAGGGAARGACRGSRRARAAAPPGARAGPPEGGGKGGAAAAVAARARPRGDRWSGGGRGAARRRRWVRGGRRAAPLTQLRTCVGTAALAEGSRAAAPRMSGGGYPKAGVETGTACEALVPLVCLLFPPPRCGAGAAAQLRAMRSEPHLRRSPAERRLWGPHAAHRVGRLAGSLFPALRTWRGRAARLC